MKLKKETIILPYMSCRNVIIIKLRTDSYWDSALFLVDSFSVSLFSCTFFYFYGKLIFFSLLFRYWVDFPVVAILVYSFMLFHFRVSV